MLKACVEQFAEKDLRCVPCLTLPWPRQVHNKRARIAKSENNNSKGLLVFPYNEKTARQDGSAKVIASLSAVLKKIKLHQWVQWKKSLPRLLVHYAC